MRRILTLFLLTAPLAALLCLAHARTQAQDEAVPSRITAAIDESKLTVLHGNTHPLAQAAFDQGPAADSLPMDQMLLVLQRSAAQQAALERLLADQQDKTSPNYHQWLSPGDFGLQFGASDQDVQKISGWLESHGFHINSVSRARNVISFSGTAGDVRTAFHTAIHQYVVNDREHISNANDPSIPTALAGVVAGISSLNDFFPHPNHHAAPMHGLKGSLNPHLTLTDGNGNTFYVVGPTDFATIYGITPLWNAGITGSGQTIAIVSGSDIDTTDVTQFRTIFGLPAITFTKVIPQGSTDPGVVGPTENGGPDGDEDETEAVFDVEWSGAVAKNANIDLVASKDTSTTAGIDLSAEYIVDQKLAPILSESYGQCELGLGSSQNSFYANLWSQAAAEGITVSISTGDNGSDGCDFPPSSGTGAQEGVYGLGVNGIASTPYNVAVGGTDFADHTANSPYWTATSGTINSALSYIPETAWNDTCTNSLIFGAFGEGTAGNACNSVTVQDDGNSDDFFFVAPIGGSGGVSNCTTASISATETAQCSGGYAKPSWQSAPGVPSDGKRDLPDLALFAEGSQDSLGLEDALGDNVPGSAYFACEEDAQGSGSQPAACAINGSFLFAGGTSVSAQVFAGIVALVDQKTASAQGNLNYSFYSLAAGQSGLNCNSSSSSASSSCIFHDVTSGTNAMPCKTPSTNDGTSDCSTAAGGPIGILTGYTAGTGYDMTTGLGSLNVQNLASSMPYLSIAASPATVTVPAAGQSGTATLTLTANNGFSGTIDNFACSGLPSGASCAFSQNGSAVSSLTFGGSTTSANVTLTVSTTAASAASPTFNGPVRPLHWMPVAGIATILLGGLFAAGRQRRRILAPACAIAAMALILATAGCGSAGTPANSGNSSGTGGTGTSGGTPTGNTTATVSVTNSASKNVISASFTVAVN